MTYKSYLKWIPAFAVTAASLAIFSFGCNDNNNTGTTSPGTPGQTLYFANLTPVPLNTSVTNQQQSGGPTGTAEFTLNGDNLTATVNMVGLDPNTTQLQFVDFAAQCPTAAADTNQDGFIDAVESSAVTGQILLPLVSNLLQPNVADFPTSDSNGTYSYTESVSYSQLLALLSAPSASPSPTASGTTSLMATLPAGQPLALNTRVVVVHGVSLATALPATVATFDGFSAQESLPVACGVIQIVSAFPAPSPSPSASPSASPSVSPSPSPSPSPSASPSVSPSPSPSSM
jgi:hypothetical protein